MALLGVCFGEFHSVKKTTREYNCNGGCGYRWTYDYSEYQGALNWLGALSGCQSLYYVDISGWLPTSNYDGYFAGAMAGLYCTKCNKYYTPVSREVSFCDPLFGSVDSLEPSVVVMRRGAWGGEKVFRGGDPATTFFSLSDLSRDDEGRLVDFVKSKSDNDVVVLGKSREYDLSWYDDGSFNNAIRK